MRKLRLAHIFVTVNTDPFTKDEMATISSMIELDEVLEVRFDLGPEPGEGLQGFEIAYTGYINEGMKLLIDLCNTLEFEIDTIGVF